MKLDILLSNKNRSNSESELSQSFSDFEIKNHNKNQITDSSMEIIEFTHNTFDGGSITGRDTVIDSGDTINPVELLENKSLDDYFIKTNIGGKFESSDYDEIAINNKTQHRMILKIPSPNYLKSTSSFILKIRIASQKEMLDDNTLLKIVSNSFLFSQSIFRLDESEYSITLKKKAICDYKLKLKVYHENQVISTSNINILNRTLWE